MTVIEGWSKSKCAKPHHSFATGNMRMLKSLITTIGSSFGSVLSQGGAPPMSTTQAATSQHTNGLGGPLAAQAQQAVTNIPGALTTTIGTVGNCWRQVRVPSPHDEFFYDVVVIFDPKDGEFLAKLDFRRQEEEELIVYRSSLKALIEELPVLIKQRLSLTDEIKIKVNISEIIIHA